MNTGIIQVRGDRGRPESNHVANIVINDPLSLAALDTFADYIIANYLDATKWEVNFTEVNPVNDPAPAADVNIDERGVCILADMTSGGTCRTVVPGIKPAIVSADQDGDRIRTDTINAFAAEYSVATGRPYNGSWGYAEKVK